MKIENDILLRYSLCSQRELHVAEKNPYNVSLALTVGVER